MNEHSDNSERNAGPGSGLNFSLPDYGSSKRDGAPYGLLVGLSILIVILLVAVMVVLVSRGSAAQHHPARAADTECLKKLALRLGERGLPEQAARAWVDYVTAAGLAEREKAQKLTLAATEMQKAGKYQDAIALYFRADQLGPGKETKAAINRGVHECFSRLGKYSDLYYEVKDRTSLGSEEVDEGGKVVAEIGPQKITLREFERKLDDEIKKMTAGMEGERAREYTSYLREQLATPQAKRRKLAEIIGREVLVREAEERKIDQTEKFKKGLAELAEQLEAHELVQSELAKINLSEGDYKLYYDANKSKYKEPAKAKISRILLGDEKEAEELLKTLKSTDDFAKAAKEKSQDDKTKDKGGEIQSQVRPGQWVAGIGRSEELNEALFAAEPGAILDKPFKVDDSFNLLLVREKTPERQKAYDEVAKEVKAHYDTQKRQETTDALIQSLFEKHKVTLHPGVIAAQAPEKGKEGDADTARDDEKENE